VAICVSLISLSDYASFNIRSLSLLLRSALFLGSGPLFALSSL